MKFSCKKTDLQQALNLVNRAIGGQQALPILGNVLIEVEGKRCTISATDLEISMVTSFEASVENEGSITVPAKAILNFAQYNSDKEVFLETTKGTQLQCTSDQAKTIISGESAQEYPTISPIKKDTSFAIEAYPLLEALHMTTFASAKNTLRPVLSGVYLRAEKGKLIFVTTDSYRLSEYKLEAEVGGAEISCIVPTKILEELHGILSAYKKPDVLEEGAKEGDEKKKKEAPKVEFALSSQQIEMKIGNTTLLSRLIDGKFPDYQQIIPKETKTTAKLATKDLVTTVKRMHYFAKEINNNLTFKFGDGQVHIATPETQAGKDETTLGVDIEGNDNKIALSSAYLLDFLSHIDEEGVNVELNDSMHPAVFRVPLHDNFLHLIMPLRIQDDA